MIRYRKALKTSPKWQMITPQLYAWKGVNWIGEIVFRGHDELGFLEQRGYSNTRKPWLEDRHSA